MLYGMPCGVAQAASLDAGFGSGGRQSVNIGGRYEIFAYPKAVALQRDGKTVILGNGGPPYGASYGATNKGFVVARVQNGRLDDSFNGCGTLILPVGANAMAAAVALQSDGKILVAGSAEQNNAFSFTIARLQPNGRLDTGFGNAGLSYVPFEKGGAFAYSLAVQSDGKIILAGEAKQDGTGQIAVARLTANGKLDNSFATGGKLTVPLARGGRAAALALQSDGKIVIAGSAFNGHDADFAVVRLNRDGSLDNTFSDDGKLTLPLGDATQNDAAKCVALQSNGNIILGGTAYEGAPPTTAQPIAAQTAARPAAQATFAVACLNPDGTLASGFEGGGKLLLPLRGMAESVAVQSDDKITIAGSVLTAPAKSPRAARRKALAMTRLNASGTVDKSFNGDGKLLFPTDFTGAGNQAIAVQRDGKTLVVGQAEPNRIRAFAFNANGRLIGESYNGSLLWTVDGDGTSDTKCLAVQRDGKILVAGHSMDGTGVHIAVARLNADGSLDTGFNGDGKLQVTAGTTGFADVNAITLQGDGKIILAGYVSSPLYQRFAVIRLNRDGSLDSTFSGGGKLVLDVNGIATCVAVQDDGKIVLSGYSPDTSGTPHAPAPPYNKPQFVVVRLNQSGTLDASFNHSGQLRIAVGSSTSRVYGMALQSDGKIVLAGYAVMENLTAGPPAQNSAAIDDNSHFAVARLNADGSLDSGFNGKGTLVIPLTSGSEGAAAVALQSDGKILLAGDTDETKKQGFVVTRLNPDGSLDTTFGSEGKLLYPLNLVREKGPCTATEMAVAGDGKIVLIGLAEAGERKPFNLTVARFNPDGSPDNSLSDKGVFSMPVSEEYLAGAPPLALQSDGKIIVAARPHAPGTSMTDFGIARIVAGPTAP